MKTVKEYSIKCHVDEAMRMEPDQPSIDDCLYHRCLKHQRVPQYNTNDGNGGECGACIALNSYTIWTDFKPGDAVTHGEHGNGTVKQIVVNRRIGCVEDSESVYYIVDFSLAGLTRCEPSELTKAEQQSPRAKEARWHYAMRLGKSSKKSKTLLQLR